MRTSKNGKALKLISSAQITLSKIYDAYTINLSNSNFDIVCNDQGDALAGEIGVNGRAITTTSVVMGTKKLTAVASNPIAEQYCISISAQVGCTVAKNGNDKVYVNTLSNSITGKFSISFNIEGTTTVVKEVSFVKKMNDAPNFIDGQFSFGTGYWSNTQDGTGVLGSNVTIKQSNESIYGTNLLEIVNTTAVYSRKTINIEKDKIYRCRFRAKQSIDNTTGNKVAYFGYTPYNSSGTAIGTNGSNNMYFKSEALKTNAWTEWEYYVSTTARAEISTTVNGVKKIITPAVHAFPTNSVKFRPMFIVNYNNGNGIALVDGWILEDVTERFEISQLDYKASQIETNVNSINANVISIKTYTDMSSNPMTLAAKANYSEYDYPDQGEVFLHGLNEKRNPANVDGKCIWNAQTVVLPKVMFNPNTVVPDGIPVYMVRNIADNKWWSIWKEESGSTTIWKRALANVNTSATVYTHTWNETNDIVVGYYIIKKTTPRVSDAPIITAQLFEGALNYKQATSMTLVGSISQLEILESEVNLKVANTDNKVSQLKLEADKITQRVQSTENTITNHTTQLGQVDNKITNTNNKIDNLAIGGRNLLLDSGTAVTNNKYCIKTYTPSELLIAGETYTVTICVTPANNVQYFMPYMSGGYAPQHALTVNGTNKQVVSGVFKASYYPDRIPTKPSDGHARISVYRFPNDGTVVTDSTIHWIKIEKGNKATDWTPAPEDINSSIHNVDSKIETTKNKVAEITTSLDSINLKVQSTEQTVTNHATQLNQVDNKINNAVNNIQIGGRNLALGTGKAIGDVSSGSGLNGSPYLATDLLGGVTAVKTNTAWTGRLFNLKAIAQRGGFKAGDNLVLSVYIKSDQNVTLNVASYRTKGTGNISGSDKWYENFTVTPKWQQVWFPFTADEGSLNRTDTRIEVSQTTGTNNIHWAGWKLEKGTKPTDWAPAPEDINNAIDDIQIGGRNYIIPSKVEAYSTYASAVSNNFNGWTVTKKNYTNNLVALKQNGYAPEVGKTYTMSGYAELNGTPITDTFFPIKKLNTYMSELGIFEINNGYFKITQKWTNENSWIFHTNFNVNTGDVIVFKNLKFEEGNRATSWTPATETIQAAIDSKANATDVYTKTETYTQAQVNSQIKLAKDEINLSVSNTYETKTSVTSKVNTAKTEAINSASADTINKINSAKNELNTTINNIKIGGRNLFKGYTNKEFALNNYHNTGSFTQFRQNLTFDPADYLNKEFTISFYAKSPNGQTELLIYNANESPRYFYFSKKLDTNLNTEWKYYTYTFTNIDRGSSAVVSNKIEIYAPNKMGVLVKQIKVELGNKATDWSPAPEDIQTSIDSKANSVDVYTKNEVYTKAQADSAIKIAKDEINLSVSQNYETKTNVESKITNAVDNIQIGGRNYFQLNKILSVTKIDNTSFKGKLWASPIFDNAWVLKNLKPNTKYIMSGYATPQQLSSLPIYSKKLGFTFYNKTNNLNMLIFDNYELNVRKYKSQSFVTPNDLTNYQIIGYTVRHANDTTAELGNVLFDHIKLEEGTKASDWTPAPEDIDSLISGVQSQVTTTNNKVATIETNLSGITQRVSSTESTVSSHTTQLGTVDNRINTAKNAAISTAAADATTKANNAQSKALADAKNYTNGQVTTVTETLNSRVAEIKATTDSITQKVSATETKVNTVTTNLNNLQIGGRNLLPNSKKDWTTSRFINIPVKSILKDHVGKQIAVSFDCKLNSGGISRQLMVYKYQGSGISIGSSYYFTPTTTNKRYSFITTVTESSVPSGYSDGSIAFYDAAGNNPYTVSNIKIELGNKVTDYTLAPEDIDSAISSVDSKVTTTNNKIATIETNLNGITQRVSSTESTTTTLQNTMNNVTSPHGLAYAKDLVIYGESNKYYPVYFKNGNQNVLRTIKIWRSYSEQAPNDWYSSTHKGALMLTWQGNFGGWGGASYKDKIVDYSHNYTTLLADCYITMHSMGYVFFLRGGGSGGAIYHFASDQSFTPEVYYNGSQDLVYNHANDAYKVYAANPLTAVNAARINGLMTAKESSVTTVKNQVAEIATNLNSINLKVQSTEQTIGQVDTKVNSSMSQIEMLTNKIGLKVDKNNVIASINLYTQENESGTSSGVKISGDKIDLQGQVTFSSLADSNVSGSIKNIFTQQNNQTVINGGMIKTQTIKGNDLLLKGNLTVTDSSSNKTFEITSNGDVNIQAKSLRIGSANVATNNDVSTAINNLQVGGRNYVLKSDTYITGNNSKNFDFSALQELRGKTITVSIEIDLNAAKGSRVGFEPSIVYTDGSEQYIGVWQSISTATTAKKRISATHTIQDKEIKSYNQRGIYIQGVTSGTARIGRPKLEIGTKATDWTLAPEDTVAAINSKVDNTQEAIFNKLFANGQQGFVLESGKVYINGEVIKANVISGTAIKAGTLDASKIKAGIIQASAGGSYLNLNDGSMMLGTRSLSNYLQWTGSQLNIKANSISIGSDAIATTADVTNAVNNIQIGGRNYIIASKVGCYSPYNTINTSTPGYIKSTWNSSNTGNTFTINVTGFTPKKAVYTISGIVKVNGSIPTAKYFTGYASTYGNNLIRNDYDATTGKFVITQSYPGNSSWLFHATTIRASGSSDVVELFNLQFEEGNKATDWNPASEDKVNNTQEDIFNKLFANGQQGFTLESGRVYINGEVIKANTISGNVIKANTLSGEVIKAGTLNASKIKAGVIQATSGGSYFDLDDGSMLLGSKSSSNYLEWTGYTLNIKANSLTIGAKSVATSSDISSLQSKISSTEQKITPTAILNAVNEQIGKGGAISTTSTKLEKGKFTIYNGALVVQNNKAKDVMWCNTEGWLTASNLFINGNENPSNLEIGGSNGNKGVGIRTNGSSYSAYLDFGVLDRNASFAENVRTGKYHRFITEASDRTMLNLVTPHFNIRPFDGYSPTELTVQGYIEAFHDISTRHNINAVGTITAGGFKRSGTGFTLIATDTIDTIKYAKNNKSYLEVRTPKFGAWGIDIWASDEKIKENIVQINLKQKTKVDESNQKIGLDLINNINHYSYNYIEEYGGEYISCGYVAQELQELNSNIVLEVEQDDGSIILQPSAPSIIPNITLALKQQQDEINELKKIIKLLENKLDI